MSVMGDVLGTRIHQSKDGCRTQCLERRISCIIESNVVAMHFILEHGSTIWMARSLCLVIACHSSDRHIFAHYLLRLLSHLLYFLVLQVKK